MPPEQSSVLAAVVQQLLEANLATFVKAWESGTARRAPKSDDGSTHEAGKEDEVDLFLPAQDLNRAQRRQAARKGAEHFMVDYSELRKPAGKREGAPIGELDQTPSDDARTSTDTN